MPVPSLLHNLFFYISLCTVLPNETEAETDRLIYDMYLQGNGCGTIAKRLVELGIKNKRGTVEWHDHGVMGMIKNEKYKASSNTRTSSPVFF